MADLGVDVGGTFTDIVSWDGISIAASKTATTPDPADAIAAAILPAHRRLVHGTTVATNALLQRDGAGTALVTDPGFDDVLEIGRQDRPSLYDSNADRSPALVGRGARFSSDDLDALEALQPEAVAIALLYAHIDGTAERSIAERLATTLPASALSLSSEVSPEMREFERTSTTVINAYLQPKVAGYLRRLREDLEALDQISVMRSSGGLMSLERAAVVPAAVLLSGPAGGAVATAALAASMGRDRVISFDMGGTSTDVSRIEGGRPAVGYERSIDGYACRLPAVAIHTVGAGGGSIAWRDAGGALRVGPRSAGANPGPASYGRGGIEPAVTDANSVLGRLPSELSGDLVLDAAAAETALLRLDMGTALEAAAGIIAVVEENMARAIRRVSVEEGVDPADATLVAFGGAGGLHATALARRLGMASVIVPPLAGVFSALGLLLSPGRADTAVAVPPGGDVAMLVAAAATAAERAIAELNNMTGSAPESVDTFVDLRYRGQSHELTVPWSIEEEWPAAVTRFHELHLERNGFARPQDPVEIIVARAEATGPAAMALADLVVTPDGRDPRRGRIEIIEAGVPRTADLWWRPSASGEIIGPAIIAEPSCTTFVGSGERAVVQSNGALELQW
ncbi:MAG: hydantoinase/oxoprolinase family protein [Acidimicrobiia bacterium]|nr:hydantoinase/oxoprolinase family protein [Acidimicrobiia bacterium]